MRHFLTFFAFVTASVTLLSNIAAAQQTDRKALLSANPQLSGCELTPYQCDTLTTLTPAPAGFKAFYINHYGRHGSRANVTGEGVMNDMLDSLLTKASRQGDLTDLGDSLANAVHRVVAQTSGRYGSLLNKGVEQHQGIARRMYERFPEVFGQNTNVNALSSTVQRCIVSMAAFTGSLQKCNRNLNFRYACAPCYQDSINIAAIPGIAAKAKLLASQGLERPLPADIAASMYFKDSAKAAEYIRNPENFLVALNNIASISPNLDTFVNVFKWIPFNEIFYRWQLNNRAVYLKTCNSAEMGAARMARADKPVIRIVKTIDDALLKRDRAADLCFGHDYPLLTIMNVLDLDLVQQGLSVKDINDNFLTTDCITMASNLQLIFYSNDTGDVLVKILHNEKEHHIKSLEAVSGPYYKWPEVRDLMMKNYK